MVFSQVQREPNCSTLQNRIITMVCVFLLFFSPCFCEFYTEFVSSTHALLFGKKQRQRNWRRRRRRRKLILGMQPLSAHGRFLASVFIPFPHDLISSSGGSPESGFSIIGRVCLLTSLERSFSIGCRKWEVCLFSFSFSVRTNHHILVRMYNQ